MSNSTSSTNPKLNRALGLFPATTLVVGSVVGSGIFVSSASMARDLGSAKLLLFAWVLGGMFTLFGSLTLCELAGMMPKTGGLYEYLRKIYGEPVGYLYGWANFVIAGSGSIAAISFVFGNYFSEWVPLFKLPEVYEKWEMTIPYIGTMYPLADAGIKLVGVAVIIILTSINICGIKLGSKIQSTCTSAKMIAFFIICAAAFLIPSGGSFANYASTTETAATLNGSALMLAITMALSGAFWSYDGWGNVAYVGDEIKDAPRTLPKAIILGTFIFIGLYVLLNLAYLYVLPVGEIANAPNDRVASKVINQVLGHPGVLILSFLILLSSFDCVNSTILTNSRVYFAMAQQKAFFKSTASVHPTYQTPYVSLLAQGGWAIVLLVTGGFDLVSSMYVFINWILYTLMALGLFILRFRNPNLERPFKIPGYPWIPLTFLVFSVCYVFMTLVSDISAYQAGTQPIIKSLMGVVLVLVGWPLYIWIKKSQAKV